MSLRIRIVFGRDMTRGCRGGVPNASLQWSRPSWKQQRPSPCPVPIGWGEGGRRPGEGKAERSLCSSRREEAHFSNVECGVRNGELSQSLLTSAATSFVGSVPGSATAPNERTKSLAENHAAG